MSKKHIVVAVILMVLMVMPTMSFAAGKMVSTQEDFYVVNSYSIYGYVFAKVENTGDKPVEYSAGLLEIYDANGDTLASDSYLSVYPKILAPGEYGYVKDMEKVETELYTDVDDYMLTVTGKSNSGDTVLRLPVVSEYLDQVPVYSWRNEDYLVATVTNDQDKTIFGIQVVMVLLDDEDHILDIEQVDLYSGKGLTPGSSLVLKEEVSSAIREAYERKGYKATKADAIAYVYVDN